MKKISLQTGLLHCVVALALCSAASAEAQSANPDSGKWQFEATPYLWAAGLSGTARAGPRVPEANVDAGFSDLAESVDFGLMGSLEARKDRWGILLDLFHVKLSKDSDPLLGGRLGTAEAEGTENIFQVAGAYRISNNDTTSVDVLLGLRYASVDLDLSLSPSPLLPAGRSRGENKNWTDGFAGVRIAHKLSEKWALVGYADIGAGGTDKSWQAIAGANYHFSNTMTAKLGYRILSMNYDKPEFLYNVKTAGPYIGLGIRF